MSARDVAERLRKRRSVAEVPTEEGLLFVRGLNGRERVEYFKWLQGDIKNSDVLLSDQKVVALTLCEKDGTPVFGQDEEGQREGLEIVSEWSHEDVTAAAKKACALSGIGKVAEDEAEKK